MPTKDIIARRGGMDAFPGSAPAGYYTAKPGDTLENIAAMFGTPGGAAQLYNQNRATMGVQTIPYPGMRIKL